MTRRNLSKEKPLEELKILKQRVVELEARAAAHHADEKSNQFEKGQKYKAAFESANDAMLLINKKGGIIDVNKKIKDISGYAREEIIGENIASLIQMMTNKSLALTQSNFLKRLVDVNAPPYEVEMIIKNRESITIEISAQPLMENDKIVGYLAILRDVTGRKQAAEVPATIEQNLRNSLDILPMGFRINDIDDNTLYSNQAFLNIFGYENIDEVNTNPPLKHYTPESYAGYFRRKERYLRGESVSDAHEVDIVRKDGVIRHLQLSTVELDWNGKKQFQTLFNDVTERKKIEEALKASEEKYSTLIEQSTDGIIILNDRIIEFANKMMFEMTGYSQDEILGKSFPELFAPEYAGFLNERYRRRQAGEKLPGNYELELLTKGNRKIYVETKIQPILYKGKDAGMVIIRDITDKKLAAEALKISEENFRNSMDSSSTGIRIIGDANSTLYANQALLDIIGYKNIDEVRANPPLEYYTPESRASWVLRREKIIRGEPVPDNLDIDIIRKDGAIRHLQIFRKEVFWNGKLQHQTLYNDVTDRKKAEEAVKVSEQNFRNSLDSSFTGIYIADKDWHILYVNQAFLDIYGYKNIDEVRASPPQEHRTPESYAIWVLHQEKMLRGEPVPDNLDIDIIRKDGAIRHLQVVRKDVLWDGKQQSQLIYNDITDRKKSEEALRESEEKYRLIVENSQDIIFTLNSAGEFIYVSPSVKQMLGYNQTDLIGLPFASLVHPEDLHVIEDATRRGDEAGNQTGGNQYRFRHASGEWRWQVSRGTHMLDTSGKSFNFIGIANDITAWKKAEEALTASEQNFRNSLDSSPIGIRIGDEEDQAFYANQAFLDIFGYENIDEVRASPPKEHYTPESYAGYLRRKEQDLRGESPSDTLEIDIIRKDGANRHLQLFGKRILWNGQQQNQVLYIDITTRIEAEEALKTSEQNFRNSLDSSPIGVRIVDVHEQTLYANQALLDIFGYENIDELLLSPPKEHFTTETVKSTALRKEQLLHTEKFLEKVEIDITRKDNTIRHLQVSPKEVLWNGKKELQLYYNDITERKQAEERLEQVAQEWRTTFDSITDLISVHDKDNRIIRVNKAVADRLKTTPIDLIGKYCHEVMHGTKEPPANCPHLLTLKTGKSAEIEWFNPDTEVYFHESSSPVFNEKGEVTGSIIVDRDITQQKRIEQQLIMTDRLASIGELSSGIAHELNNPLTSVIGFSQLLMEGDAPANIKEDLATIYSEAQRAVVIVKNLLTFARKHAPVKQLSQVNTVIEDVLRLRAYEQKVNNIEVEKHLAINLPEIMMDHFQIQQVFLNIIVNAEFAMLEAHQKGKMVIATEKIDGIIKISFTDDGPGISEENLKRIFDPFFTTKEVGKGTGLGLSICHGIVNEHGGKIYAKNENGPGTSFIVELPINGQ